MDLLIRHAVTVMDLNRVDSVRPMPAPVGDASQSKPESEAKGDESNG